MHAYPSECGLRGGLWDLQVEKLVAGFDDADPLAVSGIFIGGEKYMMIRGAHLLPRPHDRLGSLRSHPSPFIRVAEKRSCTCGTGQDLSELPSIRHHLSSRISSCHAAAVSPWPAASGELLLLQAGMSLGWRPMDLSVFSGHLAHWD